MDKKEIAQLLEEMAFLLEFHGENPFKVRAFQQAARALANESEPLEMLLASPGRLEAVKGIGKSIAAIVREFAESGRCSEYEQLRARAPKGMDDLVRVPGLGPKRLRTLVERLGTETLDDLERACRSGEVEQLPGFGAKTVENILAGIEQVRKFSGQWLYAVAAVEAQALQQYLQQQVPGVERLAVAGSLRRKKEIVRDIDMLAVADSSEELAKVFLAYERVEKVLAHGETKSSVVLKNGLQVDLRVVSREAFPCALQYFTGSKEHNTHLRARAKRRGLKLNEYGLFREAASGEEVAIPVTSEEELYEALGLAYIAPELREDLGEIEAAEEGSLPRLIELQDYRGTLHCHTNWSDGADSIEEMGRAAHRQWGLEYLAICDHSRSAFYAGGLSVERLLEQIRAIREQGESLGLKLLTGCECDILPDGSLDYPDEVLEELDIVVVSIHSHFQMSAEEMTRRICQALTHPCADILGHVSGRLLLVRDGYPLDIDRILDEAAKRRTIIEINGDPHRLDLDWRYCRGAKARGLVFAVNPDAHSVGGLANISYGVNVARKGWLTKEDVVNCLSVERLQTLIRERREFRRACQQT